LHCWRLRYWVYSWLDNRLSDVFGLFIYVELWFGVFVLDLYLFDRALPFSFRQILFRSIGIVNWSYISLFLCCRLLSIRIVKRFLVVDLGFLGFYFVVDIAFFFCLFDWSFE
jgi:hypothetical protein